MASTSKPQQDDDRTQGSPAGADVPPTPDEDGPHDVPDDKVIEKTLPEKPRGSASTGRAL